MCGLAGFIDKENKPDRYLERVNKTMDYLKRRGPDNSSVYKLKNGGFVHTRLKILDLSDSANQPMVSSCGRYLLVFNGEIYNFEELQKKYHLDMVRTHSDTEVLLNALIVGDVKSVLENCIGMFALAFYDMKDEELILARDRLGQKPLYYYSDNSSFYFSSDIRAVKCCLSQTTLNYSAIDYFFSELVMPQPETIYNEIKQVEPGKYLKIKDFKLEEGSYFDFRKGDFDYETNENEWINKIEQSLFEAVNIRLKSDVDLGFFLSGGVDSGLIVSMAASFLDRKLDTYTVVYEDRFNKENKLAKELAKKYNTNHNEVYVDFNDVSDALVNLIQEVGEPFADSSLLPTYFVSREMKNQVSVAISGDGGDELFGYPEYRYSAKLDSFSDFNWTKRSFLAGKAKLLNRFSNEEYIEAALNRSLLKEKEGQLLNRKMAFSKDEKVRLYCSSHLLKSIGKDNEYHNQVWGNSENVGFYKRKWEGSFKTRLLNDYLVKIDRGTMYNSLEVRSPFLDHRLVDLAGRVPPEIQFKNGHAKYLLKKLGEKYIDKGIFNREKMGFGIPVNQWLTGQLKGLVDVCLNEKVIKERGFFNSNFVNELVLEHTKGVKNHTHKIWALLCFELWCQNNLD